MSAGAHRLHSLSPQTPPAREIPFPASEEPLLLVQVWSVEDDVDSLCNCRVGSQFRMSWVLSQFKSSRLLVIQGGHLTTRKSHCKAAADRIMCWGGQDACSDLKVHQGVFIWGKGSVFGLRVESGVGLRFEPFSWTRHLSSGCQLSPCSILRQEDVGRGVRRALGLCIQGTISCPRVQESPSPGNPLPVLLQTHHSWVLWLWAVSQSLNFSLLNCKIWVTALLCPPHSVDSKK